MTEPDDPPTFDADRNRRVQSLFQRALDLDRDERTGFLDENCADALDREEVEALLSAFDNADEFLAEPAISNPGEQEGDVIGRYRLLEKIGEGGFGVVWMAEQQEPVRRRVAVKIIKLGMDTRQVVARFEAERQALALMDHPNIAKVLDGGATDSGRPYFVMELVRGMAVTEYCDQANLDTAERLELFHKICLAVQHAHQKGIIHRDLKPSNVLVTLHDGEPVPKVIDFGVAKATSQELTQKTLFTQFRQMIGTPEYMAPEQAEMSGLDVDTRADVYSLGVILYELLTGTKPIDARELLERGYEELLRHVREVDPPKPSTRISTLGERLSVVAESRQIDPSRLGRVVRGELDWIAMRALEKQRQRRYPTARALADDVRRFLSEEAVEAGPPTAGYRAYKFLRRNRAAVATLAMIIVALLAGVIGTGLALQEANAERREANRQLRRANVVIEFLHGMLAPANPMAKGRPDMTVREVLNNAEQDVTTLTSEPDIAATVRSTVGRAYRSLGLVEDSEKHLREALSLRQAELGAEHSLTGESLTELAQLAYDRSKYQDAIQLVEQALSIAGKNGETDSLRHVRCWIMLSNCYSSLGKYEDAQRYVDLALPRVEREDCTPGLRLLAMLAQGDLLKHLGKFDAAAEIQRKVVDHFRVEYGQRHPRVAAALFHLGETLLELNKLEDADAAYEEALSQQREFFGDVHASVAGTLNSLATTAEARGNYEQAIQLYRESLAADPKVDMDALITRANIGMILMRLKRWEESLAEYDEALKGLQDFIPPDHPTNAMILQNKARLLEVTGRLAESEAALRQVMAMRGRTQPEDHPQQGVVRSMLGMVLLARGQAEAADEIMAEAVRIMRAAFPKPHFFVALTLNNHAMVKRQRQLLAEAERLYAESATVYERAEGRDYAWAEARASLAAILFETQRVEQALEMVREAHAVLVDKRPESPQRWWAEAVLGEVLASTGRTEEARPLLAAAAENFKSRRPQLKPRRIRILSSYIQLLERTGATDEAATWRAIREEASK